jgi:DNA-directed RNA polymerase I, II, and III subunit RPABC2
MSDNESDYYSDSTESDSETEKVVTKKNPVINLNAAKKFGNYIEDESEPEIDDSEPEDVEEDVGDVEGGGDEDDETEEGEVKEDDDDAGDDGEPDVEDEEEDDDIEIDEEGQAIEKNEKTKPVKPKKTTQLIIADDEDDEDEYEENYLQKFEYGVNKNYITEFHPECLNHNSDEVSKLTKVIRDENNIIIDPLHKTLPYLTKYEKARVLGQRAKQIETGAKPFVKVPENIVDGYIIAELELREKKIPFIIKRPIPSGAFEYWNIKDLENINF